MDNNKLNAFNALMQLFSPTNTNEAENDSGFQNAARTQIKERDEKYTLLLEHFVTLTKARNIIREIFKWLFLLVVIGCMIALTIVFIVLISKTLLKTDSIKQIKDVVPAIITSIVGVISSIIVIPLAITKYLFSTEEDKNITQIILHTQEHDNSGGAWSARFNELKEESESSFKNSEGNKQNLL